ncbi:uncharacterized protein Socs36E isoform X2 [Drosophila bipectinata]|uniref:uncharacterized protein Socs36E isoform X2 n=1 Tax=Drosophila bipectinata TaxID=42026 RepID=UPI001C8A5658|nr:uncharacterized protein LOC108132362 isoform X2 [Drosophila bipectinata]
MGHHFSKPTARANSRSSSTDIKEFDSISLAEEQLGSSSPAEVRQIIIKIQLAKMENGNAGAPMVEQQYPEERLVIEEGSTNLETEGAASLSADTLNANGQIVNVGVGVGLGVGVGVGVVSNRTAGSSTEAPKTERQSVNNNNLAGSVGAAISTLQLHDGNSNSNTNNPKPTSDDIEADVGDDADDDDDVVDESLLRRRRSSGGNHESEVVEYCEVLESLPVSGMLSTGTQLTTKQATRTSSNNSCCRSRSSKTVSMGASVSSSVAGSAASSSGSKRRCCKCKCRDAFRGLRDMLPTSSGSNSSNSSKKDASAASVSRKARNVDRRSTPATLGSVSGSSSMPSQRLQSQRKRNSVAVPDASHHHHQVIIRITSPRFVVESPNGRVTVVTEPVDPQTPITPPQPRPMTVAVPGNNAPASSSSIRNVTVHSQIDFMHCLVPDLEKITNSSFYWGKMDRYEAEHLLEGKPEGTFLLRDSAQDEFLFSVTFRKYGRSLHARIEQSGHKFSFDCHDPCVFTAPTVTGLLEHYKDPACVMFFEPCLTMPLHRRQTFSLQQLARATIVSNTNYDGVNQLELPGRLKSYLKEYHYKQKLRVKPCDLNTPVPCYGDV